MEVLNEIIEFVTSSGRELDMKLSGSGNHQPAPVVVVSDMGINELGSSYYGIDQRPVYRRFDFYRDGPLAFSATAPSTQIRPSGGTAETPSPAFHSRQLLSYGQPDSSDIPKSFHLYIDNPLCNATNRCSAIPVPDLVSQVQFQSVDITLSMDTLLAQANIYESQRFSSNSQLYQYNTPQKLIGSMTIRREGWKRKYRVDIARYRKEGGTPMVHVLYWKGSTSTKAAVLGDMKKNASNDLKLVLASDPSRVVAVWNGGDDSQHVGMGNLCIYEKIEFNEEGILIEVVTSCLAVVMSERSSFPGLLSWLTR